MIALLLVVSVLAFGLSLLIAATEAIRERDWPRDTGWYPLIFLVASCFLVSAL